MLIYVLIGYDFFGSRENLCFDTAIPTSQLDSVIMNTGVYDELFISLDTAIARTNNRPEGWFLKNIMHAKFENDLESGSLDADGHKITKIQIYRRILGDGASGWVLVGEFEYKTDFNVYSFVDVTAESGRYYEYSIVPVAGNVIGEKTISDPTYISYNGVFISDKENNYKIQFDFESKDTEYNKNFSSMTPLNGEFPIVVYGDQDYRTGSISFLPLSETQIKSGGTKVDGKEERLMRDKVTSFLNNGKSKVLRNDNGDIMIMATSNVKSSPKSNALMDIQSVSFDYTELGEVHSDTLLRAGLVGGVVESNYTYDEYGNVIWDVGR